MPDLNLSHLLIVDKIILKAASAELGIASSEGLTAPHQKPYEADCDNIFAIWI